MNNRTALVTAGRLMVASAVLGSLERAGAGWSGLERATSPLVAYVQGACGVDCVLTGSRGTTAPSPPL